MMKTEMAMLRFGLMLATLPVLRADDPVPFSHKRHAPLKLDCAYCHATSKTGERASYPEAGVCMACHAQIAAGKPDIQRLAALPKTTAMEPERSVYMLAEFAFFSHARHRAGKVDCQKCHGAVWEMEEVTQVLPMTMKACVACHRTMHAATACGKCHELGQ